MSNNLFRKAWKQWNGNDDTTTNSHEVWKKDARLKNKRMRKSK